MGRYFRNGRSFLNRYNLIVYDNGCEKYLLKITNNKNDKGKLTTKDLVSWIDYAFSYFISAKIISIFGTNPIKLKNLLNVETKDVNRFDDYLFGPQNFSQSITHILKQSFELSLKLMMLIDSFKEKQVCISCVEKSHTLSELELLDTLIGKYKIDLHKEDIDILKDLLKYLDNLDYQFASRYPHSLVGHPKINNQNQGAGFNQDIMKDFSKAFLMINHLIKHIAIQKDIQEIVEYIERNEVIIK